MSHHIIRRGFAVALLAAGFAVLYFVAQSHSQSDNAKLETPASPAMKDQPRLVASASVDGRSYKIYEQPSSRGACIRLDVDGKGGPEGCDYPRPITRPMVMGIANPTSASQPMVVVVPPGSSAVRIGAYRCLRGAETPPPATFTQQPPCDAGAAPALRWPDAQRTHMVLCNGYSPDRVTADFRFSSEGAASR